MLSKVESAKDNGNDSSSGRLLRDIEEISRALYLNNASSSKVISPSDRRSKSAGRTRSSESKSNSFNDGLLRKDRKSSIWNWKPLKALTHIGYDRFACWFFLHVHAIEGLPSNFDDISLCVQWKRKNESLQTRPARVCQGVAEFEETLMHRCSVYGSRTGPHHSAKYEPKLFMIYAYVIGNPEFDLGNHWVDLTRLLPLNLEELEEKSSSKWTTSFKLTGKAKGAVLNVSFGFSVIRDSPAKAGKTMIMAKLLEEKRQNTMEPAVNIGQNSGIAKLQRVGSVPGNSNRGSQLSSLSFDIQNAKEQFPNQGSELAQSISFLYQKLDGTKLGNSQEFNFFYEQVESLKQKPAYFPESFHDNIENDYTNGEFSVVEQGIEVSLKEQLTLEGGAQVSDDCGIETIDVAEIFKYQEKATDAMRECDSTHEVYDSLKDHIVVEGSQNEGNDGCGKELINDKLDSVTCNLSLPESEDFDSSSDINEFIEQETKTKNTSNAGKMVKSFSFDDITESVANDFLKILAIEGSSLDLSADMEPESPRELLLRQFEEETLASGKFVINFDVDGQHVECGSVTPSFEEGDSSDYFDFPLVIQPAERVEGHGRLDQPMRSKRNAKLLENLETKALMNKWGLDEKAFQNSPRTSSGGFGSPIYLPHEEPVEFPPLGEGLGTVVQTKDGGYLRSMKASLFRNAKNGGRLIMQVSTPIVLPVTMGSSIMEILQHWASVGYERMSMQVSELMPLEDIKGKMLQHVAWEVASRREARKSLSYLLEESQDATYSVGMEKKHKESPLDCSLEDLALTSIYDEIDSDYVSLEDLAPLVMDKIESLSVEGLKIQSGMSDQEAPSSLRPQSIGESSAFLGKSVKVGGPLILEGDTGLHLAEIKDSGYHVAELISLSITLDEWMKLDAGNFGDDDVITERTLKIIAAHMTEDVDIVNRMFSSGSKWGKPTNRGCGFLGNNFTVVLRVQLRDPLRDYENVGAPMLALVQVERVFLDPIPKVHCGVSDVSDNKEADDLFERMLKVPNTEEKLAERIKEGIPWFKINEVHIAGFNAEHGKNRQWGATRNEQSGARWLLANGMGKKRRQLYFKSNAILKSSQGLKKMQSKDIVWSISSHVRGPRAKWKELATLNLHVRNPDVIFLT